MLRRLQIMFFGLMLLAPSLSAQLTNVPGHVLIKLKPLAQPANFIVGLATQTRAGGGVWIEKALSTRRNIHLLQYDVANVDDQILLQELAASPTVEAFTLDYVVENRSNPNDPSFQDQWGLAKIGVEEAWEISTGGKTANGDPIVVAILDSGFDLFHEDIRENIWTNRFEAVDGIDNDDNGYVDDVFGWNFTSDSPEHISDTHGHAVAGIIGAKGNNGLGVSGINWDVQLMVLEARLVSEIIEAYEYIIDQRTLYNETNGKEGAFVVATNASFGINKLHCDDQPLWGEMYEKMGQVGILTAAGTANNAWDVDTEGDMPTTCASDYLMTVLNTNDFDERYIGSAFGANSIDMGAPGQNSFTTKPFDQYGNFHGNSAAAPHLAGAIALLYSMPCTSFSDEALANPAATAMQVRNALLNGVDKVEALEDQTSTGGRLNVHNAMQILMDQCDDTAAPVTGDILISPNPARAHIQISFDLELEQMYTLRILNALGQQVHQQVVTADQAIRNSLEIPVESWQKGLYVAFIEQGEQVMSKKFVIME